jgi:UDP-3-O-[3-hydroxymyristoyl] glucosamine N-acyltransferase
MPDARFFFDLGPVKIGEAMRVAGADARVLRDGEVVRVADLDDADLSGAAVFLEEKKYADKIRGRKVGLLLTTPALAASVAVDGAVAASKDPKAAFARLAAELHAERPFDIGDLARLKAAGAEIAPGSIVSGSAELARGVTVGPNATIGPGVVVGRGSVIGAGATVQCAVIGDLVRIGPGARIGGPGFGFAPIDGVLTRVPQLGRVMIEDRVEIGSNSTVDRGAIGDTSIGEATKIDNLVQIGHNVRIGRGCVIASQVGVAGSVVIGDGVMIGGQAGFADHLTIGDGVRLAARAGLMHDVPAGETWGGAPAQPIRAWFREIAALRRLARPSPEKKDDHD